ncbi:MULTISPECIES: hypothetical protein [Kitasatospora]|uniref:Uncharacterized protein n=1 Tax=Kitasatospora setae (strain ATCC 33774 / DSM 43861 / JCM 3304 / KCC A-0304 / NBRC 14216 / KM-6054) TaxID=452652 RepID=E4N954_KITSK|nr:MULTISPECIES: hypothetical protein [Kitasatospora]BAJ27735.1 hypothetical protein KSE_19110 [Kitasatospora setae KM-6054]
MRGRAVDALRTLPGLDEAVLAAYPHASFAVRRAIRRTVVRGRRAELAARLLPVARAHWGEAEAATLLAACPPAVVAAELPSLAVALRSWSVLARRHPDAVLDHVERELAARAADPRADWWQRYGAPVAAVLPLRPARVLDLLERRPGRTVPPPVAAGFGHLLAVDAERATAWLADPERPLPSWEPAPSRTVLNRLAAADPPSLPALGRRWLPEPRLFAALLRAVPPARRAALLDAAADRQPQDATRLTLPVLRLLPRERRHREARRLHAEQAAKGWPERRLLDYTALLAPAEARADLLALTRRPDPAERSEAWAHLVAAAAADPDPAAPGTLLADLVARLRNEQDPVRQRALTALTVFPAARLTDAHADALTALATDALDARDCSHATRGALTTVALRVIEAHPTGARPDLLTHALLTLEQLTARGGPLHLPPLARRLRRGQEREVLAALRPWLDAERPEYRHRLLFALTRALGARAEHLPELDELLAKAALDSDERTAAEALELWLRPRAGRTAKVRAALAHDPSAVFCASVADHLGAVATDLLDAALAERPPTGRFLRPGDHRPLPPAHHPDRWTPRQVARAADLLGEIAATAWRTREQRATALWHAARLPGAGAALLRRHLDDPDPLLADTALDSLPLTTDPAAALPDLLAHAGDDRAKTALYAAGKAARHTPPGELAPLLAELAVRTTGSKVTSRKEAVRLAAALLPPATAAELLAAAFHAPGQHPDVRAAAAAHCQDLLDAEPVWALLAEAAAASEPQLRQAVVGRLPHLLPERHRARYGRLVAAVAARPGEQPEAARAAIAALPEWVRHAPEAADALPALVAAPDRRAVWAAASLALRTVALSDRPHPAGGAEPGSLLHRALTALLDLPAPPDPSTARDQPARQRIASLTTLPVTRRFPAVLDRIDELLRPHEELLDLRAALLARAARPAQPGFGPAADRLATALADRPLLAARLAAPLAAAIAGTSPLPTAADTAAPAALLALLPGRTPALGLLATALADVLGTRCAWTGGWLPLLTALRAHPDPDVRAAARAVVVAPE